MGPVQAIVSSVISILYYAMVIAAVWKLFQMATDLGEIKTLLTDIRRNTTAAAAPKPAGVAPAVSEPISLESAEALLREVEAESRTASEQPQ